MERSMQAVSSLYRTTDKNLAEIMNHLGDAELRYTVGTHQNSALRLYAHLCVIRHRLYNSITKSIHHIPRESTSGGFPSLDPEAFSGAHAIPFEGAAGGFPSEGDAVPPRGEIDVAYRDISKKLYDCFSRLTCEQLAGPGLGKDDFPTDDKTLLGSITYLGYHEAYTVGQIGFLGHAQGRLPRVGHLG